MSRCSPRRIHNDDGAAKLNGELLYQATGVNPSGLDFRVCAVH